MSWPFDSPDSFDAGFWTGTGRPASLDWCEENYVHSPYIAETMNTLSNLSYILTRSIGDSLRDSILALYGLHNCHKERLPTRFLLSNVSLLFVGIGSVAFHATLLSLAQALDEIPMLYTVGIITYSILDTVPQQRPYVLSAIAFGMASMWTITYITIGTALFHQISFATLILFTTIYVLFLLPLLTRQTRVLYYQGISIFLSGFLVWNLDNWYCPHLRTWRAEMGWPATLIAQGHAYWHIATGVGAYRLIVASELLFLALTQRGEMYTVEGLFFPVVRRAQAKKHPNKEASHIAS